MGDIVVVISNNGKVTGNLWYYLFRLRIWLLCKRHGITEQQLTRRLRWERRKQAIRED